MSVEAIQWAALAKCTQAESDGFFGNAETQHHSKRTCQECPVRLPCLAEALDARVDHGLWGGMTERERRALLRSYPHVTSWRLVLSGRSPQTRQA